MSMGRSLRKRNTVHSTPKPAVKMVQDIKSIPDIYESVMPSDSRLIEAMLGNGSKVPNVLYASDGRKFYPCKYCCRAFAYKRYVREHTNVCLYRVEDDSDESEEEEKIAPVSVQKSVVQTETKNNTPPNGTTKEKEVLNFKNLDDIKFLLQSKEISIKPATKKIEIKIEPEAELETEPSDDADDENRCKICNKVFLDDMELLQHKRHEHSYSKVKLPAHELVKYDEMFKTNGGGDCPLCQKPILNKGGWSRHLHTHDADVKHFCKICKKGFYRLDHKQHHEQRHIIIMNERKACR